MEWIFRNQETVAARSKYTHQLSSSNNAHPIEYFVYCSMGTVKFELLSWFSIVRDVWRQHFSVLSQKTNNISVVSSHFHLYLRISALRLPTVNVDILFIYTPNQIPDMLTNTNSFEIDTFRIFFLFLLTNSYIHYLRTCSDKEESFTWKSALGSPVSLCKGMRSNCVKPTDYIP